MWYCVKCQKTVFYRNRNRVDHKCGEWRCRNCKRWVQDDHICYMRAHKQSNTSKVKKFMFYDFETTQYKRKVCEYGFKAAPLEMCEKCLPNITCSGCSMCINCGEDWCGKPQHVPNFCVSQKQCDACGPKLSPELNPDTVCEVCGDRCDVCLKTPHPCPNDVCGKTQRVFEGDTTLAAFGDYLYQAQHKGVIAMAHNSRYVLP
jgi:hypothetical protein